MTRKALSNCSSGFSCVVSLQKLLEILTLTFSVEINFHVIIVTTVVFHHAAVILVGMSVCATDRPMVSGGEL